MASTVTNVPLSHLRNPMRTTVPVGGWQTRHSGRRVGRTTLASATQPANVEPETVPHARGSLSSSHPIAGDTGDLSVLHRKEPVMMKESHTVLPAADLQRARMFYRDRLGFEPDEEHEGMLMYHPFPGGAFQIY